MDEATQSGAESQQEVSIDSDFAQRIASMVNGEAPPDEERFEAADEGAEEVEAAAEESQADETTSEAEQEKTFTIKVNGEDRVVTESELIANAQKYEAANKRFEEAAAMRKEYEAQQDRIQQERAAERAQLQSAVEQYTHQLQTLMQQGQPDWQALLDHDPVEYLRQKEIFNQQQAQLQQAQAAKAHLEAQQQAAQAEEQRTKFQRTLSEVKSLVPEWSDDGKFNADINQLNTFLEKAGIPNNEQGKYFSAPLVKLFRDAQAYQQLINKQTPALKKVEKLPPKVEKTGQGVRLTDGRTSAMQQLKSSGKVSDAAALIAKML